MNDLDPTVYLRSTLTEIAGRLISRIGELISWCQHQLTTDDAALTCEALIAWLRAMPISK